MRLTPLLVLATLAAAGGARADVSDAGAPARVNGCVEIIPQGAVRPEVTETLPERGRSGYAATLVVTIRHGKGETVLPSGLSLQSSSEAAEQIKQAGWVFPDQDGSAGA
ncbi:MAG TPA: hypothetical protein VLM85_32630, partial [Polyangiaceae bacterium]|nr:hypothetical protein [Polyangiaceae bacterium]